jgi:hypothetical protein
MVKQRIYIPCATDNWPMSVRLRPEVPDHFGQIDAGVVKLIDDGPNCQGPILNPGPLTGGNTKETASHSRIMCLEGSQCFRSKH